MCEEVLYIIQHCVISIFAEESADCFTLFMHASLCMYDCMIMSLSLCVGLRSVAFHDHAKSFYLPAQQFSQQKQGDIVFNFPWCVMPSL